MTGEARAVAEALAARIEDLLAALPLPDPTPGWRNGRRRRFGRHGSLSVAVQGIDRGVWYDFEAGQGGDALDLVERWLGLPTRDALAWARQWLGGAAPDPGRARRAVQCDAGIPSRIAKARRLVAGGLSLRRGDDPVVAYLAGRGLKPCPALLALPSLYHSEAAGSAPAMLAAMHDAKGRCVAAHCTWLAREGTGWVKAGFAPSRKIYGAPSGAAIRLGPGPDRDGRLGLAEGIETALSAAALFGVPVWAAGTVGNFAALALPDAARDVLLFGDGDEEGLARRIAAGERIATQAGRAMAKAVGRWRREGRTVTLHIPPAGPAGRKRDWNDVLRDRLAADGAAA